MPDVITFTVPLPPRALRGNSKAGWAERKKAADAYSDAVSDAFMQAERTRALLRLDESPWPTARVTYTWRYAGVAPDIDNVARGVKVLQDTICCAPANARTGDYSNRYFLGIVRDDGGIEATFRRQKVSRRAEEGVLVEIRRQG